MNELDVVGVLDISDEDLEKEFLYTPPVELDLSDVVSETPNPISVGSYNSSFGACCCTIENNTESCGGSGFVPTAVECTPGGA